MGVIMGVRIHEMPKVFRSVQLSLWNVSQWNALAMKNHKNISDGIRHAIELLGSGILWHQSSDALFEQLGSGELSPQVFYRQVLEQFYDMVLDALAVQLCLPPVPLDVRADADGVRWDNVLPASTARDVQDAAQDLAARTVCESRELGQSYEKLLGLELKIDFDAHLFTLRKMPQSKRKVSGSYYTPDSLVQHLLDTALEPVIANRLAGLATSDERETAILNLSVCDPSAGSGHFLIACAHRLAHHLASIRAGSDQYTNFVYQNALRDVIQYCIYGVELDPLAAKLCRIILWMNASTPCNIFPFLNDHIRCANALGSIPPHVPSDVRSALEELTVSDSVFDWCRAFPGVYSEDNSTAGFDVVLGNPPFLNQLASSTATPKYLDEIVKLWSNNAARNYTDSSALFLLLSLYIAAPFGRVALVMPQSFLAARDASGVRREILKNASLESLWISNEHIFGDALVFTCAPVLHINGLRCAKLLRFATGTFTKLTTIELDNDALANQETWSHLAGDASGIPTVSIASTNTIADIAHATADFRDQYYGLAGFLVEDAELNETQRTNTFAFPPIITAGLIDLVQCHWGIASTRILKTTWRAPRINRDRMNAQGTLGPWITSRLVPKIVLATQTRIIELIVDSEARYVPSTPLITITPKDPVHLWRIAAALASPVCTALAMQKYTGAALNINAIKLSARQVLSMPIPDVTQQAHCAAWDAAADALHAAQDAATPEDHDVHVQRFAKLSCDAFGVQGSTRDELLVWWRERYAGQRRRSRQASAPSSNHATTTPAC